MKVLERFEFGHPILRQKAKKLTAKDITSRQTQELIKNIRHTLVAKNLGVALAAPQVGESVALSVIAVRPTKWRPEAKNYDLVIINPSFRGIGKPKDMWEGCVSSGPGGPGMFGKVPRYKKVIAAFHDENGVKHKEEFDGLVAQIIQHEIDHIDGILFIDKVTDTKTLMTLKEYRRQITPSA